MNHAVRQSLALSFIFLAALLVTSCPSPGTGPTGPTGPANVVPGAMTFTGSSVARGSNLSVNLALQNAGSSSATNFGVDFYMALSSTFSLSTDTKLISVTVPSIGANGSTNVSALLPIPATPPTNTDVYIYAVVMNNVSTVSNAAVVLAYQTPAGSQSYSVVVETYPPTGTNNGATNTGMALYMDNGLGNPVSLLTSDVTNTAGHYATLGTQTLKSGKYYVAVVTVGGRTGAYAFSVRTSNIDQPRFTINLTQAPASGMSDQPKLTTLSAITLNTTVPTSPLAMNVGSALNWYTNQDCDWFTFTLP